MIQARLNQIAFNPSYPIIIVGDSRGFTQVRVCICKRLRSPGIDSEESIPPAYEAWRAGTTNRVIVPAGQAENRFLGSIKGLQIRAQLMDNWTGGNQR